MPKTELEVAILNNTSSTIQHLKDQQWKVSYYTMLSYGAIIATQQYLKLDGNNHITLLGILIGVISVVSAYLNWSLSGSLLENRKVVSKIYTINKDQIKKYDLEPDQTKRDNTEFMFYGVIIIGGLISMAIVICGVFD